MLRCCSISRIDENTMSTSTVEHSPLGKEVGYVSEYAPELLFPVPRVKVWVDKGLAACPFQGYDIWNAYEMSWLNSNGLPQVAIGEFRVPAESANLIESKSFKLYLNSLNQTRFENWTQVEAALIKDLSACAGAPVGVILRRVSEVSHIQTGFDGACLDDLDVEIEAYNVDASLLATQGDDVVTEALYSDLLRSNCPVTGQPDWGSVCVTYTGKRMDREALLKYIVSFREHSGFHEQCVETIFVDLLQHCAPRELTVYARYVRRGGLDINPLRSTSSPAMGNIRLARQ